MSKTFAKDGICFEYPDDWSAQADAEDAAAANAEHAVTVYTPEGAFWSVVMHPYSVDTDRMAKAAVEAMQAEYDDVDVEPVREQIAGVPLIGYDMSFWCLDLTNTAQVRCFSTDQATYLVFSQSEDREFAEIEPALRRITVSLMKHALNQVSQS